jgi:hypothetical protein
MASARTNILWAKVMLVNAPFNNISFISWRSVSLVGGNRSTRRKPTSCRESLTNFITWCCIEHTSPDRDSNSQFEWWYAPIAYIVVNPTTMRSRPLRPSNILCSKGHYFFNNIIYFIKMLTTINTPNVQAPFGVSLLHPVLIIQGYNQNYMKYIQPKYNFYLIPFGNIYSISI